MRLSTHIVLLCRGDHVDPKKQDSHRCPRHQPELQQRVGHNDNASLRSSSMFEDDTAQPGVAPTAGEKGQPSTGHGNDAPDTNRAVA